MYRKRNVAVIGIISGIIAVIILALVIYYGVTKINSLTADNEQKDNLIAVYEGEVQPITIYQVTRDVKANNSIVNTDICSVDIIDANALYTAVDDAKYAYTLDNENSEADDNDSSDDDYYDDYGTSDILPENIITDLSQLEGMMYKLDLTAGTYLTTDMIQPEILTDDMRELDVIVGELPIGLEVGDYVDLRISFPLGQDYIAMSHKKVLEINQNTLKLIVNEEDFYIYESLKTDLALYRATKLYAVRYLEAGIQAAAENYYPCTLDVIKVRILDPNMDTSDYSTELDNREKLEVALAEGVNSQKIDTNQSVTSSKSQLESEFSSAKQEYERLQAEKEGY